MERKIIEINSTLIHYRKMGTGPILILLHPSPLSSSIFEPFIKILSTHFTVIAPDTPGYGYSQALKHKVNSMVGYVDHLLLFINTFDCNNKVTIYGTATGAQIAIAFANKYPEKIERLYIDNAAHFSNEQRKDILKNYFIDLTPNEDGSHLTHLWNHIKQSTKYFPWYAVNEESQISLDFATPQIIQQICTHYLLAGINYADAYKIAFEHEDVENVKKLIVTTTIFKWLYSPILKYTNQLLEYTFRPNIAVIVIDKNNIERLEQMKEKMILPLTK